MDAQKDWYVVRLRDGALWDGPFTYQDAQSLAAQRREEHGEWFTVKLARQAVKHRPCNGCERGA